MGEDNKIQGKLTVVGTIGSKGIIIEKSIKTADYTVLASDYFLVLDGSAAAVGVTLPVISADNDGQEYLMKCINNTNQVTIITADGFDSNRVSPYIMTVDETIKVVADNIVGAYVIAQIDGATGVIWKEAVRTLEKTDNLTLSGEYVVDGVSMVAGDLIGVFAQTTGTENGVYVIAAGSWARDVEWGIGISAAKFTFPVEEGTENSGAQQTVINEKGSDLIGTDVLIITEIAGAVTKKAIDDLNINAAFLGGLVADYYKGLAHGTSTQDPDIAIVPYILTNHANSPGNSQYWHIRTQFYSAVATDAPRVQIAISYDGEVSIYIRQRFVSWSAWKNVLDAELLGGLEAKYVKGQNFGAADQNPDDAAVPFIITNHANTPDSAKYWHIKTQFYNGLSSTGNRTQIAVQHASGESIHIRQCYSTVWTAWIKLAHDSEVVKRTGYNINIAHGDYDLLNSASYGGISSGANTIDSIGFPTEYGQFWVFNGETEARTFALYKSSENHSYYFQAYDSGSSALGWTKVVVEGALGAADEGDVEITGEITADDFILSSDEDFKEDIKILDGTTKGLIPITYRIKGKKNIQYGFSAQKVQKTHPDLIRTRKGKLAISYISIIALLVEESNQDKGKIEKLEKRVDKLEKEMNEMKKLVNKLLKK